MSVDRRMLLLLMLLSSGFGKPSPSCKNRRCLAQVLIAKDALSQPQGEDCKQDLMVPFIEYQTLSVDTKNLRFSSQLKATMAWTDPELAWNTSEYGYDKVVLPVSKVWTPELIVTNAMSSEIEHGSKDLLVYSNGTLKHTLTINTVVDCEVNLFRYPFAYDECPVAVEAWSRDGCGMELHLGDVYLVDGNHGDWQTDDVSLKRKLDSQNYIMVSLSNRYMNPFISLVMPSILIIIVDLASFALPLGGGERNCFKVTLVLSFIMFLLILNGLLPGDSQCSPIIRSHFCVCLVFLVISMLASMMLTRVARDGFFIPCIRIKKATTTTTTTSKHSEDRDVEEEAGVEGERTQLDLLRTVVRFLEEFDVSNQSTQRCDNMARKLDKICFYIYLVMCIVYFSVLIYMFTSYPCDIDHFLFWY
ncbi:unnamed protein product [Merluccius merluccius]